MTTPAASSAMSRPRASFPESKAVHVGGSASNVALPVAMPSR